MVYTPSWHQLAESYIGTTEIPGPKHNPVIVNWLVKLGAGWRDDETPWCGAFVAHCLQAKGVKIPASWAWAKSWAKWGVPRPVANLGPGTVLVFDRPGGGGHVGFYVGEGPDYYVVLGGNQSNQVKCSAIAKSRLIAARWPINVAFTGRPVFLAPNGLPLSQNEA